MAKQKKPTADSIMNAGKTSDVEILAAKKDVVKQYLDMVNMEDAYPQFPKKDHYAQVRNAMLNSLEISNRQNPIFGALIERIARTSMILQKMDYILATKPPAHMKYWMEYMGKEYNNIQIEHRRCIEAFCNIKFAFERGMKSKTIDNLIDQIEKEKLLDPETDTDLPPDPPKKESV